MPKSLRIFHTLPAWGWLFFVLLAWQPGGAQAAGRADQKQAMQIESDALRYEESTQRSVFTGQVNVNKGSIVMRGAKLEVRQDAAGNQLGTLTGSAQAPAYFRQKREGSANEFVEAQANTITYNSQTAVVTLTGNARFTRLQGSKPMDTVTGATISYNGNTDIFTVNGGQAASEAGQPVSSAGRVRVTLTSRGAAEAVSPTPTGEGALKPSLQLKNGGKP